VRRAAALAVFALALLIPAAASVASPASQATAQQVEHEVMCPICGTLLELAESPQAKREKVYVAKLAAAGKSRSEIKDALVAQYGPGVLALPKASGFDLSAYLVPVLAIVLAVGALVFSVARWRRAGDRGAEDEGAASGPGSEDAERLEADLSRYDL
jgi:cytochrome c-type biogenesis protein CcmH/NrfF